MDITTQVTETPKRLSRYKRAETPPAMLLTERDKEIVKAVYAYRLLSTEQVETLLFSPDGNQDHPTKTSICRKRLKLLYQHEYLDRIHLPLVPNQGSRPTIYCLAEQGAQLIAGIEGAERASVAWRRKDNDVDFYFLEHSLLINDMRIAVALAARRSGWTLTCWLTERELKSLKERVPDPVHPDRTLPIAPDAYFTLELGDKRASFFLEIDQATEANKRFKAKVQAYLAYVTSGQYQERYQTKSLRVLTVTTGERRVANLKSTTEKVAGSDFFWFTTFGMATAEKILTAPIWRVAGQEGRHALILQGTE